MDFVKENAANTLTAEGCVTIPTSEYAELVRYKSYLELFLSTYDKDRTWANSSLATAIMETVYPAAESEDGDA